MNKKSTNTADLSAPSRNLGLNKVSAPVKPQNEPKCSVIKTTGDLRVRGGK